MQTVIILTAVTAFAGILYAVYEAMTHKSKNA